MGPRPELEQCFQALFRSTTISRSRGEVAYNGHASKGLVGELALWRLNYDRRSSHQL